MDEATYESLASELLKAEDAREPLSLFTERFPEITIKDAYQIQLKVVEKKKKREEKVVGKKIGLTSKAMQEFLGIDEPDYGHILDRLVVNEGNPISMSELIEPKIESEIAFMLMDDLQGPGVTAAKVLASTAGVMPSLEIIDSRFGWGIKIQDSIADNASIGRVVFGAGGLTDVYGLDLRYIGLVLEKNGEIIETAAGAAVLGNPAESVAWLANKLSEYGIALHAGEIIISGSLTKAIPVQAGDSVRATFGQLGSVSIKFVE